MIQYEISCPHHGDIEYIELPDDYRDGFKGQVRCKPNDPEEISRPIGIEINARGGLVSVTLD